MQVAPGLDVVGVQFGRKAIAQCIANDVQVGALGQFQLNRGDATNAGFRIDHAAEFLQLIQADECERAVVFAHPGFIQIDDGELLVDDFRFARGVGKDHANVVARLGVVVILDLAGVVAVADAAG